MHKKFCKKGFTLIELLIVIAIIAILATIVVVSYAGAQKKSRDNKRKADLQSIASAYQVHYQETKRWYFNNDELKKINSATAAQCEGWNPTGGGVCYGTGFFNYYDTGNYLIPMSSALSSLGYLGSQPRDPLLTSDKQSYVTGKASQYMKYTYANAPGMILFTMLEDSSAISNPYSDTSSLPADFTSNTSFNAVKTSWNTSFGVNYVIGIK